MIKKEFHAAVARYGPTTVRAERKPSGAVVLEIGDRKATIPESDWIELVTQVSLHDGEALARKLVEVLHRG